MTADPASKNHNNNNNSSNGEKRWQVSARAMKKIVPTENSSFFVCLVSLSSCLSVVCEFEIFPPLQ
jgi:hypothetical protein